MRIGIVFCSLLLVLSLAQPRADFSLNSFEFSEGEAVDLSVTGLEPSEDYALILTDPDGDETRSTLTTDEDGSLNYREPLGETGLWSLEISGEGVVTSFQLEVSSSAAQALEDDVDSADTGDRADTGDAVAFGPQLDEANSPETFETGTLAEDDAASSTEAGTEDNTEQDALEVDAEIADESTQPTADTNAPEQEGSSPLSDVPENAPEQASGEFSLSPDADAETEADVEIDTEVTAAQPATPDSATSDASEVGSETGISGSRATPNENLDSTVNPAETSTDSASPAAGALDVEDTDAAAATTGLGEASGSEPVAGARSLATGLERIFASIAQVGWYSVAAMLIAVAALHLTLLFKYWIPQSLLLRRAGSRPIWSRLLAIRYYSITEKLVFVILFTITLFLAGLAGWNNPAGPYSSWQEAVSSTFSSPWQGLQLDRPGNVNTYLWSFLIALFLAWALFTLVWLFVPRPRVARRAPRSILYNLFSILVPGSGLADEVWGILLIVPWALAGLDIVSDLFAWGLGIPVLNLRGDYALLIAIYLINTVAVVLEFLSHRRDMAQLKEKNPDLAAEFGLSPVEVRIDEPNPNSEKPVQEKE